MFEKKTKILDELKRPLLCYNLSRTYVCINKALVRDDYKISKKSNILGFVTENTQINCIDIVFYNGILRAQLDYVDSDSGIGDGWVTLSRKNKIFFK